VADAANVDREAPEPGGWSAHHRSRWAGRTAQLRFDLWLTTGPEEIVDLPHSGSQRQRSIMVRTAEGSRVGATEITCERERQSRPKPDTQV
jgi:hypothetical protein